MSVKNDDEFDKVGRFKYDKKTGEYTLQTNRKGEAKTRIDNIEKGILSDGINFRDNSNFIEVGKEGQPTVEGVQNFVVELGEMVGKEIAGYHMAENGKSEVSYSFIGKYINNTETKSYAGMTFAMRPDLLGKIEAVTDFHTHPSSPRFSISDRLRPSPADLNKRNSTQEYFPNVKKFIILTKGFDPVDYTNYR